MMPRDANSSKVVCRPALARDRTHVLEFTKFIWGGHDYIQYVWDDWFADPDGLLAVAEMDGRAVGMGKITLVGKDQWWLEGFRVDPKWQGLKIGSHIHEYLNTWWLEHGTGTVRLMTSSERVQVHHLSERSGYTRTGEVKGYAAEALEEKTDAFTTVGSSELNPALDLALASEVYRLNHQLMDIGWTQVAMDRAFLKERVREKKASWWRGREGLFVQRDDDDEEGNKVLGISLPACRLESLPEFLMDVRRLAAASGFASLFAIFYVSPQMESALTRAGYTSNWDSTAYIYERRHPLRP